MTRQFGPLGNFLLEKLNPIGVLFISIGTWDITMAFLSKIPIKH
jgi:hypothetical protein